jgi:hypothetical protein
VAVSLSDGFRAASVIGDGDALGAMVDVFHYHATE